MAFPGTPRDLVAEIFLNGWVDVTTDVRQTVPITTKRARGNEQGKSAPATSSLTLTNNTGNYTPRNPFGAYYGLLSRNVPVRHALRIARDAFGDPVVDDWGAADTGQDWDRIGAGGSVLSSDWQVAGGKATHSVPATSAYRMSVLDVSMRDAYVKTPVTISFTDVLGGPVEPANIVLRYQNTVTYYMVRARIRTDEAVTVEIRRVDGTETVIASAVVVAGVTHTSSQTLWVAGMIEEQTIRGKAWVGALEPYAWTVTAHDSVIATPGKIAIRSGVDGANTNTKPIIFSYDEIDVRSPRFAGEAAKISPRWDETHKIKTARLDAAGILRRLGQGASPIKSAPRRFIAANNPVAYWTMEDNQFDLVSAPLVGSVPFIMSPEGTKLSEHYGQGKLGSYLPPTMNLTSRHTDSFPSDFVYSADVPVPASTGWTIDIIRNAGLHGNIFLFITTLGGVWRLAWGSTSFSSLDPWGGSFTAQGFSQVSDNNPHHYRFRVDHYQTGDVFTDSYIDGVNVLGTSNGTHPITSITRLHFEDNASVPVPVAIGHLGVWGDGGPPGDTDATKSASASLGWAGETAGRRLERLCTEEGIPFSYVGNLDDTIRMGPQGTRTLLELLRECEEADGGTLFEPRGLVGLSYRTRASLYNQSVTLALDYAAGHVAPLLEGDDDDQATRNKVTVKRRNGGERTAVLDTGPMSVLDPQAGGVGVYDEEITVNVLSDAQLPDIASWRVHLGTVDEERFPQVQINLAAPEITDALEQTVLDVSIDDRITIANLSAADVYRQLSQLVRGYTETLKDVYQHSITFNCAPESPYQTVVLDSATLGKLDSKTSTLVSGVTSVAMSLSVATTQQGSAPLTLWTTAGGEMPIPITIGGEDMSVTAISGASSPQTFTVTRNPVTAKAHSAGASVRLTRRSVIAL